MAITESSIIYVLFITTALAYSNRKGRNQIMVHFIIFWKTDTKTACVRGQCADESMWTKKEKQKKKKKKKKQHKVSASYY
jgi:hypothetical protein